THTKSIHETIMTCLGRASTYVDFFAQLIFQLFPKSGLVLIDSAHGEIRKMEGAFFKQFIEKERAVSAAVYETTQSIQQSGYTLSLDLEEEDANLFLEEGDERILLKRQGNDWLGKNEEVYLKTEELLTIAE